MPWFAVWLVVPVGSLLAIGRPPGVASFAAGVLCVMAVPVLVALRIARTRTRQLDLVDKATVRDRALEPALASCLVRQRTSPGAAAFLATVLDLCDRGRYRLLPAQTGDAVDLAIRPLPDAGVAVAPWEQPIVRMLDHACVDGPVALGALGGAFARTRRSSSVLRDTFERAVRREVLTRGLVTRRAQRTVASAAGVLLYVVLRFGLWALVPGGNDAQLWALECFLATMLALLPLALDNSIMLGRWPWRWAPAAAYWRARRDDLVPDPGVRELDPVGLELLDRRFVDGMAFGLTDRTSAVMRGARVVSGASAWPSVRTGIANARFVVVGLLGLDRSARRHLLPPSKVAAAAERKPTWWVSRRIEPWDSVERFLPWMVVTVGSVVLGFVVASRIDPNPSGRLLALGLTCAVLGGLGWVGGRVLSAGLLMLRWSLPRFGIASVLPVGLGGTLELRGDVLVWRDARGRVSAAVAAADVSEVELVRRNHDRRRAGPVGTWTEVYVRFADGSTWAAPASNTITSSEEWLELPGSPGGRITFEIDAA